MTTTLTPQQEKVLEGKLRAQAVEAALTSEQRTELRALRASVATWGERGFTTGNVTKSGRVGSVLVPVGEDVETWLRAQEAWLPAVNEGAPWR